MVTALDIADFVASYRDAFVTLDAERIAGFYSTPSFGLSRDTSVTFGSSADLVAHLRRVTEGFRAQGLTALHYELGAPHPIARGMLEIPVHWSLRKADGGTLQTLSVAYVVRQLEQGWKISVVYGLD